MKKFALCIASLVAFFSVSSQAQAQAWTRVQNTPANLSASAPILLHDGRVMIHDADATDWWALSPDSSGNYATGTWKQLASTPSTYGPMYFASGVLKDGTVMVMGGEYNLTNQEVWTSIGYAYVDHSDKWVFIPPPPGWTQIGDAQSVLLPDGTFMIANIVNMYGGPTAPGAIFDESTISWTNVGTGKADDDDEEGWTLLPDGSVLTVNVYDAPGAQRYIPSTSTWVNAGTLPVTLTDGNPNYEMGPAVLLYNGTVFATGALGNSAIYTPPSTQSETGTWNTGPSLPIEPLTNLPYGLADGPACVLPNGNVMVFASPGYGQTPAHFFLYDGTNFNPVAGTPNTPTDSSYYGNMLLLPSGQMLFTDFSSDIELYTPAGGPQDAWRPALTKVPSKVAASGAYQITGTQLTGLTQGSAYGDDFQNASNYPIARLTNNATHNVVYCRTGGYSSIGVASGSTPITSNISIPANVDSGPSAFQVVTNGIASAPVTILVDGVNQYSLASVSCGSSTLVSGENGTGTVNFSDTAQNPASVTLTSNNPVVQVPSTALTVAPGQTQVGFDFTTIPVATPTPATITAVCNGVTVSDTVTVESVTVSTVQLALPAIIGGNSATGIITLSMKAPAPGVVVRLTSSDPAAARVLYSVTVPTGASTVSFLFETNPVATNVNVKLTASTPSLAVSANLRVSPPLLQSLVSLSGPQVQENGSATIQVKLNGVPATGGAAVSLSSSSSAALQVPTSITVPAGASVANFLVTSGSVRLTTPVTVTGTYNGTSKSVSISVSTSAVVHSLTFASNPVICGITDTGTVTLEGLASTNGAVVHIVSGNSQIVASQSITIPSGKLSGNFNFIAGPVAASSPLTVTAEAPGGNFSTSLTVNPAVLTTLSATQTKLTGGINTSGMVTFLGTAPPQGTTVTLKSSDTSVVVPSSVIVPATLTSTSFGIQTFQVSATKTVVITATCHGVSKTLTLTLTVTP